MPTMSTDVEQAMVVNDRDDEHQHQADGDELDLLHLEAVELGGGGRGADFDDTNHRHDQHKDQQGPVEVAESGTQHGYCPVG
jgi:hypothetical protein